MGLLTKEIEIIINSRTVKYYEEKGYIIPRRIDNRGRYTIETGTKIIINVNDLSDGSNEFVEIQCDDCGIVKNIPWRTYKRYLKEDGKYYCNNCGMSEESIKKMQMTKLITSKSFKQWCIDNVRRDILNRWDYELNNCTPSEICYYTNKKYWFKCRRNIHKSELKSLQNLVRMKNANLDCNLCNSFAQKGIDKFGEDFLEKYWDWEINIFNPWKITFSCKKTIFIKCQEKIYHGSYKTSCNDFTNNHKCPYCNSKKVHPLDSLGALFPESFNVWSDKNKKSPFEYSPKSKKEVYWKCPDGKHEDYKRNICDSTNYNFRCTECSKERDESILQEKVRLYLESLSIFTILHEYKCSIIAQNPKINNKLGRMPYDNEIKELKLVIEVMGKQHYEISLFHVKQAKHNNTNPKYELHIQQVRDRYKRIFAKRQGYFYLEIPYWTDDKDETWKKLINDKITQIKEATNIA